MASSQNGEIQPTNQEVSSPIESSSSQTSPKETKSISEYPDLHPLIVSSHFDTKSLPIPNSNSIKLGTLVSVNYAGYHLHPWEYFKEKISDLEGDQPVDSPTQGHQIETWRRFVLDDNEELKPPSLDEALLREMEQEFRNMNVEIPKDFNSPFPGLQNIIRKYRWEQEKILIDLMHKKILKVFGKESEFKSVQERRVVYKDLDRVVYHLICPKDAN